jgi:hypothetical protein
MTMKSLPIGVSIAAVLAASAAAALPAPTHIYDLNGSFADGMGGPAMTPTGGTLTASSFDFAVGNGLTTTGIIADPAAYSIEMYFRLDAHPYPYARIIYSNGTDNGLYINNTSGTERVSYYNAGANDGSAFTLGAVHHLVFTRDASSTVAWLDGAVALTTLSNPTSIITTPVSFFLDDHLEYSVGSVDFIRLYDGALDAQQVASLWNGGTPLESSALTGAIPEPASWAMLIAGFGLTGAAMRRRRGVAA